jgi:hypothetical protein
MALAHLDRSKLANLANRVRASRPAVSRKKTGSQN